MDHLENCPLCQLIQEHKCDQFGQFCASTIYDGNKTIVLLRHDFCPTSEEVDEVFNMLGNVTSLVSDAGVPGHWAVSAKPGSWAVDGKSVGHQEAR